MIKTIVVSGPESSGKTWLARNLAKHYNEPLVLEYSRTYLTKTNGVYNQEDLIEIAKGQLESKTDAISNARNLIIEDTGIIDIKVWSLVKFGNCSFDLISRYRKEENTFYLLCAPNIPYEEDKLRENPSPEKRDYIFKTFQSILEKQANFLGIVDDVTIDRLKKAINLIDSKIKI